MSESEPSSEAAPNPDRLVDDRRAKAEAIRAGGTDPYPHSFAEREAIAGIREQFDRLEPGEETDSGRRVAGRLLARRGMGKVAFLDIDDGTGRLQLQSRVDALGEEAHERLLDLDLGDFLGAVGTMLRTERGELTLRVTEWSLLAKSLRPPPDKHHGLSDVETRYRHRELDLLASPEVRELFRTRARTVSAVRAALDRDGFLEVETPVLQPIYGGALARPFTTHHNALDRDLYLRIATELYLKRCIVGGLDRVYELGKDFRNAGISPKHNPEFTMVEWYEAYADYTDGARRLEELVAEVAEAAIGTTVIERDGRTIDLASPWHRLTLREAIVERAGIDLADRPSREQLASAIGREPEPEEDWGRLVDAVLSKLVEPELVAPTFLLDYPVELSPFAKAHRSEPGLVERWEAFCGGVEIANAFSELNDPDEQRRRFEAQTAALARGDLEAQPHDEDFLQALEHGMPPTSGVGLGIDRLVMLLTGAAGVREILLFPAMRARPQG